MSKRWIWIGLLLLVIALIGMWLVVVPERIETQPTRQTEQPAPSEAKTTPSSGYVGEKLPVSGSNFEVYSSALAKMGRTYVRAKVRDAMLESYRTLEKTAPDVKWVYGETGWKNGGRFWPHRTHRDGFSVDFMVPVVDRETLAKTKMFLWPYNQFGYSIRFDADGISGKYLIDFHAMNLHLNALKQACASNGLRIKRVIFDPPLQKKLRADPGYSLVGDIPFMKTQAWVPHDSHYHVDFEAVRAEK